MPILEIVRYRAQWDMVKHAGSLGVSIKVQDGYVSKDFPVNSVSELHSLITLLREEKPVHFNDSNGASTIMVGWAGMEPVGEAEA